MKAFVLRDVNDEPNLDLVRLLVEAKLPARLDVDGAAKLLHFTQSDIPTLIGAGLLRPLGAPAANAPKFFATVDLLNLAVDPKWLNKATRTCSEYWRKKRERRSIHSACDDHGDTLNDVENSSPNSSPTVQKKGDKRAMTGQSRSTVATAVPPA